MTEPGSASRHYGLWNPSWAYTGEKSFHCVRLLFFSMFMITICFFVQEKAKAGCFEYCVNVCFESYHRDLLRSSNEFLTMIHSLHMKFAQKQFDFYHIYFMSFTLCIQCVRNSHLQKVYFVKNKKIKYFWCVSKASRRKLLLLFSNVSINETSNVNKSKVAKKPFKVGNISPSICTTLQPSAENVMW